MLSNMTIRYQQAKFLTSAAKIEQLPSDEGIEVAFVGRSNVGKSSIINRLCQQRGLAHTSKTPGRTRLINLFELDETRRLVDLPGYGFAKVSKSMKKDWQMLLNDYFEQRQCLVGLVLIMDCRHPLTELDCMMLDWCVQHQLAIHVVLNKSDKLNQNDKMSVLRLLKNHCAQYQINATVQLFSALKMTGLGELKEQCDTWFNV